MRRTRSNADEQLLTTLGNMVTAAQEPLKPLHEYWDKYRALYEGEHAAGITMPPDLESDFVPINLVFAHTETRIPLLAGSAPTWYVQAPADGDDGDAARITEMLQASGSG